MDQGGVKRRSGIQRLGNLQAAKAKLLDCLRASLICIFGPDSDFRWQVAKLITDVPAAPLRTIRPGAQLRSNGDNDGHYDKCNAQSSRRLIKGCTFITNATRHTNAGRAMSRH
jgi:hypothetical protein